MDNKTKGFTLIELMIAVLVVGILSALSSVIYTSHLRKARRVDAVNTLTAISLAEERYRSSNASYGNLSQVWNNQATSNQGYYTISISGVSAAGYTASATGIGAQASDAVDATSCTTLTLVVNNGTITKTPAACWPN